MGILQRLFGPNNNETRQMPPAYPPVSPIDAPRSPGFIDADVGTIWTGGYSDSGINVDEMTALCASAVWACVQIIAQTVATLPLHVQSRKDGTRLYDHPLYGLLAGEPNGMMSSHAFRESQMANLLLWGNSYAFIERQEARPIALWPLQSSVTRPMRINGELLYVTRLGGQQYQLRPDQVLHVAGMSIDGITGLSPIQFARQNIGVSIALERYAAKFFSNGGNTSGILKLPPMSEDAIQNFVRQWKARYTGHDNNLKVAAMPDGYDYRPTAISPENSQAIQSRVHQVREIARIYRVPLHMLGDTEKASYASIEVQNMEFYQNTIAPYVVKLESEYDRKLLLGIEKPNIQCRFNMDASLRATTQQRYAAHSQGIQAGFLTINEARQKENLPPVKGGDELLRPLNLGPVSNTPKPNPTAARTLIEETAKRVLMKEAKALVRSAKKHAGKPDELRTWAKSFYTTHTALVNRVFTPLKAAGVAIPDDYAQAHVNESIRMIEAAIESGAAIEDLSDEWTDIRPGEIAQQLTPTNN